MQSFYKIEKEGVSIKHKKLILNKPVIYLREFYSKEVVKAYYEYVSERMKKKDYRPITIIHGPKGTGKTKFMEWLLFGLHKDKHIVFLPNATILNHQCIPFIENDLILSSNKILVIDANRINTTQAIEIIKKLHHWIQAYIGLKVYFITRYDVKEILNDEFLEQDFFIFPAFMPLNIDDANCFLEKLGIDYSVKLPKTHKEIFKVYFYKTDEFKSGQQ